MFPSERSEIAIQAFHKLGPGASSSSTTTSLNFPSPGKPHCITTHNKRSPKITNERFLLRQITAEGKHFFCKMKTKTSTTLASYRPCRNCLSECKQYGFRLLQRFLFVRKKKDSGLRKVFLPICSRFLILDCPCFSPGISHIRRSSLFSFFQENEFKQMATNVRVQLSHMKLHYNPLG